MYSEKVMDHFSNPRNAGSIEDADGIGEIGNPVCGDMMTFYIKVKDDKISEIKFQTFGCVAAIAVSSMVSEMAEGCTLKEAKKISNKSVASSLLFFQSKSCIAPILVLMPSPRRSRIMKTKMCKTNLLKK